MELTYGADCEVFLHDGSKYKSAIGLIGGSKDEPRVVERGNLQEDNVVAEFAIDPVMEKQDFIISIHDVFESLKQHVNPLQVLVEASAIFDPTELEHPSALRFGCDPDFNAWTYMMNTPPDASEVGLLRTCGAHIHVGFQEGVENQLEAFTLGRILDVTHGLPSVLLDEDNRRRAVYGKAGAIRVKPYGVEYRTLSNFWIRSEEFMEWVFSQIQVAYTLFREGMADKLSEDEDRIVNAINSVDRATAKELIHKYGISLP